MFMAEDFRNHILFSPLFYIKLYLVWVLGKKAYCVDIKMSKLRKEFWGEFLYYTASRLTYPIKTIANLTSACNLNLGCWVTHIHRNKSKKDASLPDIFSADISPGECFLWCEGSVQADRLRRCFSSLL